MHWWEYWWNILGFAVIPLLSVVVTFIVKREKLWVAPLISSALAFVTYCISFAPTSIIDVLDNNEWRGFFILVMLMQLGITVVFTVIAYFVAYLIKRKKR